ncbi:MAG: xanthine dehydrogenase family protein molybdopterin-binding subunit, partial [Actinomycetota bacterium]|nr:xanthine dehydrogenase family protein molybdopterin-binding subunit [Actinomycetota bacterium]
MLTGKTLYLVDIRVEGAVHAAFVRAVVAHASIVSVTTEPARSMPGVVGVYHAGDMSLSPLRSALVPQIFARPPLASDVVRFMGEAVAVVVAESRAQAVDAAERVLVDYDFLPAVTDPRAAALPDAPLLFPEHGSNVAIDDDFDSPAVTLEDADVSVECSFVNQRIAPVPMESNGCLAVPTSDSDGLILWLPCQAPFAARTDVAHALGLDERAVRVIAPAIGGGFGARIPVYPEQIVVAALAHRLGRAVHYVETRSENMVAMTHGRAQIQDVTLGAALDGTLVGLRVEVIADAGAYPGASAELFGLTQTMSSGVYDIPVIEFRGRYVATNTTPTFAYRGAGRPEAAALVERAMDMLAAKLNMDPGQLRRKNFISNGAFPYTTATGATYDIGDYERALDEVLTLAGYERLREQQRKRREQGGQWQLGIGLSCYVEITGADSEFGSVEVHPDGRVTVRTGTTPTGQGHETAWAQLVSGTLAVDMDVVTVVHSDTGKVARGGGTMGSRSLQLGGSAVFQASHLILEKAKKIASRLLEVDPDDVVPQNGGVAISGAPNARLSWAELASAAQDAQNLPPDMETGLFEATDFQFPGSTYPFGAHIAVVQVDIETGAVELLRHIAVDDCGTVLNPLLVEGQVHGGIAQGVAQALFEHLVYDDLGNPLNASLMSYGIPSAAELPPFETVRIETPTPLNPLGAKGIGESATIGSTPAVQN